MISKLNDWTKYKRQVAPICSGNIKLEYLIEYYMFSTGNCTNTKDGTPVMICNEKVNKKQLRTCRRYMKKIDRLESRMKKKGFIIEHVVYQQTKEEA